MSDPKLPAPPTAAPTPETDPTLDDKKLGEIADTMLDEVTGGGQYGGTFNYGA